MVSVSLLGVLVWGFSYTLFTLQTEAKRSGANRTAESTPFTLAQNAQQCAFHNSILFTLHTVECGSFHTGSEAKRSALFSVVMGITEQHHHKLGPGSDGARAAQSLTPPAPHSRGRLGQVTDPDRHARTMYAAKCLVTNRNTN